MARPRTFDEDQVLERALEAFWDRGYEGTSMAELVTATGLQKSSLYNAFGDKEQLYFRALERYHEDIEKHFEGLFADAPGASGIEAWMQGLLQLCSGKEGKRGCFAANAIAERAMTDPRVKKIVSTHERRLRQTLLNAVETAQEEGAITVDVPAPDLAELLWTFAKGLRFSARGGESTSALAKRIATLRVLLFGA